VAGTIHKYPLEIADDQFLSLPTGAEILSVQFQTGVLCLWAMVNPSLPISQRHIKIHGTGHFTDPDLDYRHIGTVLDPRTALVWHIFEV
jgi:hypothetical protein